MFQSTRIRRLSHVIVMIAHILALAGISCNKTIYENLFTPAYESTLTSVTPESGMETDVVSLEIYGTSFMAGSTVTLSRAGYPDITATGVTVVDETRITCSIDLAGAMFGTWDVMVTGPTADIAILPEGFTVLWPSPSISGITPNTGEDPGTVTVTNLAGGNFKAGATVRLVRSGETDIGATGVNVTGGGQITCTIGLSGALTGAWDVVVANLDGQSATLSGGFTVTWPQFRVIFNANGGTGSMADQFITRDSSANLTLNVFTRSGYTFANWNTLANGSGTTYTDTALFPMGSADVTLYAQWTADSYTITYMLNGGTNDSGNPASYTVETPTITLQPATRAGYEFGGWYSDAGFTVQVTQIPVSSTGDRTLYAQWVTGYLDTSFDPGTGANGTVRSVAVQSDGKILIGGDFTTYNGVPRNRVARLNTDGSLDLGFDPGTGLDSTVKSVVAQTGGKVLIGGYFSTVNSVSRPNFARLNADGSRDAGFNLGTGPNSYINSIVEQSNGKLLVGGYFTSYNGSSRTRVARLNADGSLDGGFVPNPGADNTVECVASQTDGKVLIGGSFNFGGDTQRRMARFNTDGSLDGSLDANAGVSGTVHCIAVQTDEKLMIGGAFIWYHRTLYYPRNYIVRANADGSLDAGFNIGSGLNNTLYTIVQQSDGKLLIGGDFTSYNGTARSRIARINTNGSPDTTFDPGTGANGTVYSIAIQGDGKIVIGGDFTTFDVVPRNRVARIVP